MPTHKDVKAMAKSLRDALAHRNLTLSHSECLEIVAGQLGFADWNTLSARLTTAAAVHAPPGHPDSALPETPADHLTGVAAARVPLIPLRDVVVYPEVRLPLFVGRQKSRQGIEAAMQGGQRVMVVTQRQAEVSDPAAGDLYEIGTFAKILSLSDTPEGNLKIMTMGISRARLDEIQTANYPSARITLLSDIQAQPGADTDALRGAMMTRLEEHAKHIGLEAKLAGAGSFTLADMLAHLNRLDLSTFVDTVAARYPLPLGQKQQVLEMLDVRKRLEYVEAATRHLDPAGSPPP